MIDSRSELAAVDSCSSEIGSGFFPFAASVPARQSPRHDTGWSKSERLPEIGTRAADKVLARGCAAERIAIVVIAASSMPFAGQRALRGSLHLWAPFPGGLHERERVRKEKEKHLSRKNTRRELLPCRRLRSPSRVPRNQCEAECNVPALSACVDDPSGIHPRKNRTDPLSRLDSLPQVPASCLTIRASRVVCSVRERHVPGTGAVESSTKNRCGGE